MPNDYVDQVQVKGVDYDLREAPENSSTIRTDVEQELTNAQKEQARRNLGLARRYGYRRAKANSDPDTRITYLYDAVGMTPAGMTFDQGTGIGAWSWGGWQGFVEDIARPVMLKNDGTVDYELDHSDQTKKIDGTASDIENTSYAGNAMVEIGPAFRWIKRYEDADYQYVIFCDVQYDDTYHAYAHTSDAGEVKDAFYVGMFTGPYNDGKLRSLATGSNPVSQNAEVEITRAKANGDNFYILYKSAWEYIGDLLTLIGKNDNAQAVFGSGVDKRKNSITGPGALKDKGPFYGTNDGLIPVKVLWIENFWGNMWQRLAGYINNSGNIITRMYGPYCDTPVSAANYNSYNSAGVTPSGTSGGYAKTAKLTDANGLVIEELAGSSTTYLCDGGWFNNSQVDFAFVGAGYGADAGLAGPRAVYVTYVASSAPATFGSRLSKKPA